MPKTSVADWSTTAADNTDINSIPLAENQMYPRNVNNAFREMMAQIKTANFPSGGYAPGGTDVAVADGGTGLSSYTAGDLLYATGATTLAKLAKGTADQVLTMNAGATAPEWQDVDASAAGVNDALFAFKIADLEGARLNMVGGIADAYDSETDVDTATSTNESYDSANDLYSPTVGSATLISGATGTAIGDMTGNGGLAAAFDGTDSKANGACAREAGAGALTSYIGKDWGSGNEKTIAEVILISSNDRGFVDGADGLINFRLLGNTTNNTGTAVELATFSFTEAASPPYTVTKNSGVLTTTAYRYHWVEISHNVGGTGTLLAQLKFYEQGAINNMTLVSNAFTATAVPTQARIAAFIDPQVSMTINTDFTAEASRDGGTTYTAVTLALVSNPVGTVEQYEGSVSISAQPSGSSMKYRLKTLNNKDIDVTGIVFQWG